MLVNTAGGALETVAFKRLHQIATERADLLRNMLIIKRINSARIRGEAIQRPCSARSRPYR